MNALAFKKSISEGTLRMNRMLNLIDNFDEDSLSIPTELQIKQFKIDVDNLENLFEEKSDGFFNQLLKIIDDAQQNPELYYAILDSIRFKKIMIFDTITPDLMISNLMIHIMSNFPVNECQISVITILNNISFYCQKVTFGLPLITNPNLFIKFMKAPLITVNEMQYNYPYISWFYSKLIETNLSNSFELVQAFCNSGLYELFIQMCLSLTKEDINYIVSWAPLIEFFSSSKFPISEEKKVELIQIYNILFSLKEYQHFILALDHLIDSSSDKLNLYIYQSPIFVNIITILNNIYDKTDLQSAENRKTCMFILYKMILKDKNKFCDLTFLPIDIIADLIKSVAISDQVSALQLLTIYLKNDDLIKSYSIVDELEEKGVYNFLMENCNNFSFGMKSIMTDFFILSMLKANPSQLQNFCDDSIFVAILENIDCSNIDQIKLFSDLLMNIFLKDDLIPKLILPNSNLIFRIADDVDPQNNSVIREICNRISFILQSFNNE